MKSPVVSYIIPTRNRGKVLRELLVCIVNAAQEVPSEIIVIDNASDDDTPKIIKKHFPQIKLFINSRNSGAEARNIGIDHARGEYICMLDDDSYPLAGTVTGGVRLLQQDHRIGAVAYRIVMRGNRYWTNGLYTTFAGCGALFRTDVLRLIGGFPSGYGFYVEEYDVSFRIWEQGYRIVNTKNLLVFHAQVQEQRNVNEIMRVLVENNVKLYLKFLPSRCARAQIEHELFRYRAIAEKENAIEGFQKGLEHSFRKIYAGQHEEREKFSQELCDEIFGFTAVAQRIRSFLQGENKKRILCDTVGKFLPMIINTIARCNATIVAVSDSNPAYKGKNVLNIPIVLPQEAQRLDYDAVVCGSSSLCVNDECQARINPSGRAQNIPLLRICEYDDCS